MPFMMRSAEDDFVALKTADAMERAGAVVVAITPDGTATHVGALAPHTRFIVWARVADHDKIDSIDDEIAKELSSGDR